MVAAQELVGRDAQNISRDLLLRVRIIKNVPPEKSSAGTTFKVAFETAGLLLGRETERGGETPWDKASRRWILASIVFR